MFVFLVDVAHQRLLPEAQISRYGVWLLIHTVVWDLKRT